MKNNWKKSLKNTNGITLIALVITIIVLLILAGVSLSMVLNQDGIFSRAEQATDKYGQAKARETLEIAFGTLQAEKYEERLSVERLDTRITEEINKMGGTEIGEDKSQVVVDGYIFLVDRTVPKIVEELGPANGVIVTAKITQNGDWKNPVATVTGTITKYGGGTVVSTTVTATNGVTIPADFPTTGGSYTISNITTDTEITITTTDSDGKTATKTIPVKLVRDNIPPVISGQEAILSEKTEIINGMKIRIKANAADNESGLKSLTYKIEPNTIKDGKAEGTLTSGVPLEVEATAVGNYTVTFTATDNANNTATATAGPVRASDAISIAYLKKNINAENYPDFIGTKVDYKDDTVAWRVFYYDASGEFGDGAGTIYLKRDYDANITMTLSEYYNMSSATANGLAMMKQLNPDWKNKDGVANLGNEKAAAGLCDTNNWTTHKTADAKYAIGTAPIEMWTKAYNAYLRKYEPTKVPSKLVNCGRQNEYGYGWGLNGESLSAGQSISIDTSIQQSAVIATGPYQWLASPSSYYQLRCVLCEFEPRELQRLLPHEWGLPGSFSKSLEVAKSAKQIIL